MENWDRKDYYQSSESENEEEVAIEKLKERAQLIGEDDYIPELATHELDFNELTQDEQIELVERHSPELLHCIEDFQYTLESYKQMNEKFGKANLTPEGQSYYALRQKIFNLLFMHFSFYVMLKANGKPASNHPVINTIKNLIKLNKNIEKQEKSGTIKKEAKVPVAKHVEISEKNEKSNEKPKDDNYQRSVEAILKNKGIRRKRKKVDRNVRVKNKMKYLKKVKKRQSTYGYVERPKTDRYGGESTGIRKDIVKSIKIK
ncbi:unnamed protein product [Blepharisma stoltei]|uniref:Sas10 C-terminal domain-containing protein n=1 Tax=Blepharisma stoltei TaxID=1481888 RepID=A0AAU9IV02_9CILI|nr:unnamed protein product [Blepharisma stoltei]